MTTDGGHDIRQKCHSAFSLENVMIPNDFTVCKRDSQSSSQIILNTDCFAFNAAKLADNYKILTKQMISKKKQQSERRWHSVQHTFICSSCCCEEFAVPIDALYAASASTACKKKRI